MAHTMDNSTGSFDSKEKEPDVYASLKEVRDDATKENPFKRFSDKFNVWLASRGLEGHG